MGNSRTVIHYIETEWNDGRTTKDSWHPAFMGKPTKKNFLKVISGQALKSAKLVHVNGQVLFTTNGGL